MSETPDNDASAPTGYDNFLYLLSEMEAAIARGQIRWPPGALAEVRRRLVLLVGKLGQS